MTTHFAGGFCYFNRMLKTFKHSIRLVYFYFIFQSQVFPPRLVHAFNFFIFTIHTQFTLANVVLIL